MKKFFLLTIAFVFVPCISHAQVRINIKFDISRSSVADSGKSFTWNAKEVEFEKEFRKNRLVVFSGFAIGVRKEGPNIIEGDYLYLRTYRKFVLGKSKWELDPSFGLIYGLPGLRFESTEFKNGAYTHVNLVRNIEIPYYHVGKAAVLYPELSVALRRKFKRLNFEPVVGVRIMRYGILKSDYRNGEYKEKITLSPSAGLRIGFRF